MPIKGQQKRQHFGGGNAPTNEDLAVHLARPTNAAGGGVVVVKQIPLNTIWADVMQPRRAIPAKLRGRWDGNPADVNRLLLAWIEEAAGVYGGPINAVRMIDEAELPDLADENNPPILSALFDLIKLAIEIKADGLINPITVAAENGRYRIETGERRFLAHWLLAAEAIPARVVERRDVWRQSAENGARQGFNAIETARQIALLQFDLIGWEGVKDFFEVVEGDCDRAFYAQALNIGKLPNGGTERIMSATGLPNRSQITRYRSLLNAPNRVWMLADNLNYTERRLRSVLRVIDDAFLDWAQNADDLAVDEGINGLLEADKKPKTPPAPPPQPVAQNVPIVAHGQQNADEGPPWRDDAARVNPLDSLRDEPPFEVERQPLAIDLGNRPAPWLADNPPDLAAQHEAAMGGHHAEPTPLTGDEGALALEGVDTVKETTADDLRIVVDAAGLRDYAGLINLAYDLIAAGLPQSVDKATALAVFNLLGMTQKDFAWDVRTKGGVKALQKDLAHMRRQVVAAAAELDKSLKKANAALVEYAAGIEPDDDEDEPID